MWSCRPVCTPNTLPPLPTLVPTWVTWMPRVILLTKLYAIGFLSMLCHLDDDLGDLVDQVIWMITSVPSPSPSPPRP